MIVGTAVITIHLMDSQTLKEKRSVLQSVLKRVQNKFNVSIAEVDYQDLWQKAAVGLSVVSTSQVHANQQIQAIINFMEAEPRWEIVDIDVEML